MGMLPLNTYIHIQILTSGKHRFARELLRARRIIEFMGKRRLTATRLLKCLRNHATHSADHPAGASAS